MIILLSRESENSKAKHANELEKNTCHNIQAIIHAKIQKFSGKKKLKCKKNISCADSLFKNEWFYEISWD